MESSPDDSSSKIDNGGGVNGFNESTTEEGSGVGA